MSKHFIDSIDFREQKTAILGIQGSGKSELARYIARKFKAPLVYRVNPDWDDQTNVLIYKPTQFLGEFKDFCHYSRKWAIAGKIDCIIIDEADLFLKGNYDINEDLHDLILNHRHRGRKLRSGLFSGKKRGYGVALILITRRPQDIPTKIIESSKFLCVFKLEGDNAVKKLNNIKSGFGDSIANLNMDRYEFYFKKIGDDPIKCTAIPYNK